MNDPCCPNCEKKTEHQVLRNKAEVTIQVPHCSDDSCLCHHPLRFEIRETVITGDKFGQANGWVPSQ